MCARAMRAKAPTASVSDSRTENQENGTRARQKML
jgi:hypothetical protein